MPELPEAETIVRGLRASVVGKKITAVEVVHPDVLREPTRRFAAAVRGRTLRAIDRRGKNVLILLDAARVLAVNLGMTGRLLPLPARPHPDERPSHPAVRFALDGDGSLVFDDTRRFGTVECLTDEAWHARSARMGPEPLSADFGPSELHLLLSESRAPARSWLLDQRRVAGVGNIYANEALYLAGIHPQTPARSIDRAAAARLHAGLVSVLGKAIDAGGTTLRDYRNADGDPGRFAPSLLVYGRDGEPCVRCGRTIVRTVFGGRSAFHCPECQPKRRGRRVLRSAALGALLVFAGAASMSAQETPGERLPVREVTLDNGMRFLVLPRPGAPTVAFVVQVAVGGVHERLGSTGIAHLLEHLLFKGTTSIGTTDAASELALFERMDAAHDTLLRARAEEDSTRVRALAERIDALEDSARAFVVPNELDRIFTEAGARGLNATTASEATTYFVELPANRAELWFLLESDRMRDPVFREFYAERRVVTEERRMRVDTSPAGFLQEAHLRAAFTVHPYGVPVVGYMSDLETLSRRDVADYYRRFYGPNNAVVAVVGDVDPDRIERWARRYFGPLPRGDEPAPVLVEEPRQLGERRIEIEWDAEPRLRIGWHVPSALHEDSPAIAILASVLAGGRTSRLHRRLVTDDRIATGVYASTGPGDRFPQLFQIEAIPLAPHGTDALEEAIYEEIERVAREGPTASELERVRNQVAAGNVRRIGSNLGLAFQLAHSESLEGDWRATFRVSSRLAEVTSDHVRRVAAMYLERRNRTVAVLVPAGGGR